MVNPDREFNALAALDILARADSAAFERGRGDADPYRARMFELERKLLQAKGSGNQSAVRTALQAIEAEKRMQSGSRSDANEHLKGADRYEIRNGSGAGQIGVFDKKAQHFAYLGYDRAKAEAKLADILRISRSDGLSEDQARWTSAYDKAKRECEQDGKRGDVGSSDPERAERERKQRQARNAAEDKRRAAKREQGSEKKGDAAVKGTVMLSSGQWFYRKEYDSLLYGPFRSASEAAQYARSKGVNVD